MGEVVAAVATVISSAGTAGGLGATLIGGLVSGIGMGMMEKARAKEEERARIAEEKRREERYKGVGQATRFWENESPTAGGGIDPEYQRVEAQGNFGEALNTGGQTQQQQPGERFRNRNTQPRYTFNRQTRSIQYG